MLRLSILLLLAALVCVIQAGIFDSMYCGRHNCYEIMGVERTATKKEINKRYRTLAKELHPDHNKAEDAHEQFEMLVAAYETLRNEVSRNNYDYLLDNPDIYMEHFYRFFSHSTPKVDVAPVLIISLIVLSIIHYLHKHSAYNRAIDYAVNVPHIRSQAKQLAESEGLLEKKYFKGMTKEEQRLQEKKILRDIVESKLDIQGGYQKPEWTDILAFQLLMLPFNLGKVAWFHVRRFYKYTIMREEFDDVEKDYRTRKVVGLSETQWDAVSEEKKASLYKKELWYEANKEAYLEERKELERIAKATSNKYKQQKRMAKKEKVPENWND
ncbi:hypothetical protein ACHWQZ_G003964 [Mnemiopsis leidyi]